MRTSEFRTETSRPRWRDVRVLVLWIGLSIGAHALLLVALPAMQPNDGVRVDPLEVTFEKLEPPRVSRTSLPRRHERAPEQRTTRKRAKEEAPRAVAQERAAPPSAESEAPPQLLALPREASAPEPEFMVPATEPRTASAPQGKAGPPPQITRAPSPADAPAATPVVPPNFNAAYLRNPPPRYPVSARRNGEQGTVTLKILVTRDGLPASITVQATSGYTTLDQAALEAVRGWRFAPARRGTQPVEAWVLVPIVFKLEGVS